MDNKLCVNGLWNGCNYGVPGHDERDFEFAQKYEIPITRVIDSKDELPYSGQGKLVNSKDFDGLNSDKAFDKVTKRLEKNNAAKILYQYRLRDWGIVDKDIGAALFQ